MNRFLPLALLLSAPLAFATPPEAETFKATIEKDFVAPLNVKERKHSKMSRSRQPAMARRVRVLDAKQDAAGKAFVTFAIDAKYGYDALDDVFELEQPAAPKAKPTPAQQEEAKWQKDAITGCLYPETNEIFVDRGGTWYPGGILLGKKGASKPVTDVCQATKAQVAAK